MKSTNTKDYKDKLVCIVGPTASGKSELAVVIAKKFNGEIISCDSRQIYLRMDIGTGKVPGTWRAVKNHSSGFSHYEYKSVVHHCIDYVDPNKQYSVAQFTADAQKALADIRSRGKLPILCGGTGQWVDAIAMKKMLPEVKPNVKLRKSLEKLSLDELYEKLKQLDPDRAAVIDWHNPRRLIRALEIVLTTGKPVPVLNQPSTLYPDVLYIGIYPGQDELYKKIDQRLADRLATGLLTEVENLHKKNGLSWERLESFGLEYKYLALLLQKKLSKQQMLEQLSFAIKHYAKRQMTWFRKNENILWMSDPAEALEPVAKFLK